MATEITMEQEQSLPDSELRLVDYVEARAKEITAMDRASGKPSGKNRAFQSVPNHMRRRAASHNIKRLPRRLHSRANKEIEDIQLKQSKRPSRKHRRRPSNLLAEYNRRKRRIMWLETHIWHAKRFHMHETWGYKVPNFPNDKSTRACYRASNRQCLMWDLSYLICVEICGKQETVIRCLQKIIPPCVGNNIHSQAYLNGSIEGNTFVYMCNKFPKGAIGPVSFMWKPLKTSEYNTDNNIRNLWLWTHPSTHEEILNELKIAFSLEDKVDAKTYSLSSNNNPYEKSNVAKDLNDDRPVQITTLKDNLCRFRLIGPSSHSVVTDLFKVADVITNPDETNIAVEKTKCKWWKEFYSTDDNVKIHNSQFATWNEMKKIEYAAYLPPGTVLGLTVKDPRLALPLHKHIVQTKMNGEESATFVDSEKAESDNWPLVSSSPLWESHVRENVKETKVSEHRINEIRADNLLPGSIIDLGEEESRIPVLLIQQPGCIAESEPVITAKPNHVQFGIENCGSGWDVILPGGWGMAFWIGLVYRGARVGGLRELKSHYLEMGQMYFPNYHPDTLAGINMQNITKDSLEMEYKKKPPAKRPNYAKLGINEPFQCPWNLLFSNEDKTQELNMEVQKDSVKYFVVRCKHRSDMCQNMKSVNQKSDDFDHLKGQSPEPNDTTSLKLPLNCLYAVHVKMLSRGTCDQFSHICKPTTADVDKIKADVNYTGPREPLHKLVLKSGLIETNVPSILEESKQEKQTECTTRQIIGYVTQGGYSLKLGQGAGIGYISYQSYTELRAEQNTARPLVLVRCPTHFEYRFAVLILLEDWKLFKL